MSKVVLVTGASRGIGHAIAQCFVQEGYNVIGTATSEKGIEAIENIGAKSYILNVKNSLDQLEQDYEKITSIYNKSPEILINNAGITQDSLIMRMGESQWEDVILTNLTAIFKLSKIASAAMMKSRWGRIISIGSIIGSIGNPGQCNYSAAKSGLEGFSKSLARELAKRNILVNVVAPGFIETDMTKAMTEDQIQRLCDPIPLKKTGKPEDVANLVLFLASERAQYITGQTFHVNGGLYMT